MKRFNGTKQNVCLITKINNNNIIVPVSRKQIVKYMAQRITHTHAYIQTYIHTHTQTHMHTHVTDIER